MSNKNNNQPPSNNRVDFGLTDSKSPRVSNSRVDFDATTVDPKGYLFKMKMNPVGHPLENSWNGAVIHATAINPILRQQFPDSPERWRLSLLLNVIREKDGLIAVARGDSTVDGYDVLKVGASGISLNIDHIDLGTPITDDTYIFLKERVGNLDKYTLQHEGRVARFDWANNFGFRDTDFGEGILLQSDIDTTAYKFPQIVKLLGPNAKFVFTDYITSKELTWEVDTELSTMSEVRFRADVASSVPVISWIDNYVSTFTPNSENLIWVEKPGLKIIDGYTSTANMALLTGKLDVAGVASLGYHHLLGGEGYNSKTNPSVGYKLTSITIPEDSTSNITTIDLSEITVVRNAEVTLRINGGGGDFSKELVLEVDDYGKTTIVIDDVKLRDIITYGGFYFELSIYQGFLGKHRFEIEFFEDATQEGGWNARAVDPQAPLADINAEELLASNKLSQTSIYFNTILGNDGVLNGYFNAESIIYSKLTSKIKTVYGEFGINNYDYFIPTGNNLAVTLWQVGDKALFDKLFASRDLLTNRAEFEFTAVIGEINQVVEIDKNILLVSGRQDSLTGYDRDLNIGRKVVEVGATPLADILQYYVEGDNVTLYLEGITAKRRVEITTSVKGYFTESDEVVSRAIGTVINGKVTVRFKSADLAEKLVKGIIQLSNSVLELFTGNITIMVKNTAIGFVPVEEGTLANINGENIFDNNMGVTGIDLNDLLVTREKFDLTFDGAGYVYNKVGATIRSETGLHVLKYVGGNTHIETYISGEKNTAIVTHLYDVLLSRAPKLNDVTELSITATFGTSSTVATVDANTLMMFGINNSGNIEYNSSGSGRKFVKDGSDESSVIRSIDLFNTNVYCNAANVKAGDILTISVIDPITGELTRDNITLEENEKGIVGKLSAVLVSAFNNRTFGLGVSIYEVFDGDFRVSINSANGGTYQTTVITRDQKFNDHDVIISAFIVDTTLNQITLWFDATDDSYGIENETLSMTSSHGTTVFKDVRVQGGRLITTTFDAKLIAYVAELWQKRLELRARVEVTEVMPIPRMTHHLMFQPDGSGGDLICLASGTNNVIDTKPTIFIEAKVIGKRAEFRIPNENELTDAEIRLQNGTLYKTRIYKDENDNKVAAFENVIGDYIRHVSPYYITNMSLVFGTGGGEVLPEPDIKDPLLNYISFHTNFPDHKWDDGVWWQRWLYEKCVRPTMESEGIMFVSNMRFFLDAVQEHSEKVFSEGIQYRYNQSIGMSSAREREMDTFLYLLLHSEQLKGGNVSTNLMSRIISDAEEYRLTSYFSTLI